MLCMKWPRCAAGSQFSCGSNSVASWDLTPAGLVEAAMSFPETMEETAWIGSQCWVSKTRMSSGMAVALNLCILYSRELRSQCDASFDSALFH